MMRHATTRSLLLIDVSLLSSDISSIIPFIPPIAFVFRNSEKEQAASASIGGVNWPVLIYRVVRPLPLLQMVSHYLPLSSATYSTAPRGAAQTARL